MSDGTSGLDPAYLERYSRQLMLRGFGGRAQKRLREACVSVTRIPAGGAHQSDVRGREIAGWTVAYLAAAGVGRLRLREEPAGPVTGADDLRALNADCRIDLEPLARARANDESAEPRAGGASAGSEIEILILRVDGPQIGSSGGRDEQTGRLLPSDALPYERAEPSGYAATRILVAHEARGARWCSFPLGARSVRSAFARLPRSVGTRAIVLRQKPDIHWHWGRGQRSTLSCFSPIRPDEARRPSTTRSRISSSPSASARHRPACTERVRPPRPG